MSGCRHARASEFTRRDFLRTLGVGTAATVGAGYGLSVWGWGGEPAGAAMRAGELDEEEIELGAAGDAARL